jgi:hypothetical protein
MAITHVRRRLTPPIAHVPPEAPIPGRAVEELTYKGYRIELESYAVNAVAWSPRVVVSVSDEGRWARQPALYATNAAKFPTRDAADRSALDVAKAWIDTAVGRQPR